MIKNKLPLQKFSHISEDHYPRCLREVRAAVSAWEHRGCRVEDMITALVTAVGVIVLSMPKSREWLEDSHIVMDTITEEMFKTALNEDKEKLNG